MLTKEQTKHLQTVLLKMQKDFEKTRQVDEHEDSMRDASGELSMVDNHPADMGTELYERERDQALEVHADAEIQKVEHALSAIQKGDYGICEVCQKSIGYERLEAIPYTTLCIEHANMKEAMDDEQAHVEIDDPFMDTRDPRANDVENSFAEVAEYGTSDTVTDDPIEDSNQIENQVIAKDEYEGPTNKYTKNRYNDEYESDNL